MLHNGHLGSSIWFPSSQVGQDEQLLIFEDFNRSQLLLSFSHSSATPLGTWTAWTGREKSGIGDRIVNCASGISSSSGSLRRTRKSTLTPSNSLSSRNKCIASSNKCLTSSNKNASYLEYQQDCTTAQSLSKTLQHQHTAYLDSPLQWAAPLPLPGSPSCSFSRVNQGPGLFTHHISFKKRTGLAPILNYHCDLPTGDCTVREFRESALLPQV